MRNKMMYLIILIVSLLSIFLVMAPNNNKRIYDFINQLNAAKMEHRVWSELEIERFQELIHSGGNDSDIDMEQIHRVIHTKEYNEVILKSEAKEDVVLLFDLLKSSYSGYEFFGGDSIFHSARDTILTKLEQYDSLVKHQIQEMLYDELKEVIMDGHFIIEDRLLIAEQSYSMYYVPELYFDYTGPLGNNTYLRPSITPTGEIKNVLVGLSKDGLDLPDSISIANVEYGLKWVKTQNYHVETPVILNEKRIKNVPIIESRSLFLSETDETTYVRYIPYLAEQYQDEPIFIMDLRGNVGGNDSALLYWLQLYLENDIGIKVLTAQKNSLLLANFVQFNHGVYQFPDALIERFKNYKDKWEINVSNGQLIENNNLLFVLVDKNTTSAAESFLYALKNVENVVLVGSNTNGSNMFGNVCYFLYLPNSGLKIGYGTNITFFDTMLNEEGLGMMPDLWVNPTDALSRVLELIKNYKLK